MNRTTLLILTLLFKVLVAAGQTDDFIFSPVNVSQGLSDNQVRYILQLSDGRLVFKTSGNINLYDGKQFKYIHQTAGDVSPLKGYDGFYRIYQGKDSLLWIKDFHKLMCVDLRTEKYVKNPAAYFKNATRQNAIDDIFLDSKGQEWILSSGRLWMNKSSFCINIKSSAKLQDIESENDCIYLFFSDGESQCYDLKKRRKLYSSSAYPSAEQKLFCSTSMVVKGKQGFFQLRNGSLGGFFYLDSKKRIWRKMLETNYTLNTLALGENNTAYISCAKGIWRINCITGEKKYFPILKQSDGSILNTEISTVFYDRQGGLWLGTLNQGLLYYHPSRYQLSYFGRSFFGQESYTDVVVNSFAEDRHGKIYIKTASAVYSYSPSQGRSTKLVPVSFSSIPSEVQKEFSRKQVRISSNSCTAFLQDVRVWRWTGTQDGLKLFDPGNKKELTFYTSNGLSNNFIQALLEDRNSNIWATTSYGITKLRVDPLSRRVEITTFGQNEGTLKGEYSAGAIFESADGTLYFGGINGFNTLKEKSKAAEKLPFRPIFTALFLRGEKVETGSVYGGRSIMSRAAPYTKEIELSYDQNFLTLQFSALNYKNPAQTFYRYRLKGIESEWRETSAGVQNTSTASDGILSVTYTNLPHGEYTFEVLASGSSRNWSGSASKLRITILPPWWKTTAAYVIFTLLFTAVILALIFLYLYYSRKKIEQKHREEILLLRIRNLIDQCNFLELEKESYAANSGSQGIISDEKRTETGADDIFLSRALKLVEENLDSSGYSVEHLSRDLCMDRTGLYRKLITLLDKSPSIFIRNIRLQKAAELILTGELSIAEIAERVGFSSPSYLSKCFQEMFGCRPSEYAEKVKKST